MRDDRYGAAITMGYCRDCGLKAMPDSHNPQPCPNCKGGIVCNERFVLDREFAEKGGSAAD